MNKQEFFTVAGLVGALFGIVLAAGGCSDGADEYVEKRQSYFPVVGGFEAPGRGTADIAYAKGVLWIADDDDDGTIYRVNPATGSVLSSIHPAYGPPGALCAEGDYLYVAAADTGAVYKHELNPRLVERETFETGLADIRGLYAAGGKFYVYDQATRAVYEFDAAWTPGPSYAVGPGDKSLRGFAYFKNRVWSADNRDGWINRHGTANFDVADTYCTPGYHPCGLAWDGSHLFLGDGGARKIYKLKITE